MSNRSHRQRTWRCGLAYVLATLMLGAWTSSAAMAATDVAQQPFAPTSPWNTSLPAAAQYTDASCSAGLQDPAWKPWINAASYSMPVYRASNSDPTLNLFVNGQYWASPHVPVTATPAAGTDRHLVLIEPDGVHSDELWKATVNRTTGTITAGAAARYDLNGSGAGGSALLGAGPRASNISALAGLIRSSDVQSGAIAHALALTIPPQDAAKGWVWPADMEDQGAVEQSYAGSIHLGQLVSIPASVDLATLGLSPIGRMIATALQRYGAYVADTGGAVAVYAEPTLETQLAAARTDMVKIRAAMRCATLPTTAASYAATVQRDHPMAYYRLDEASGARMASQAGAGTDGAYVHAPTFGQLGALGSESDSAIALHGLDNATIPVAPHQNVTLELWVKTTDTAGTSPAQWWTGESLVDGDAPGVALDYGTSLVAGKAVFHVGDPASGRDATIASTTSINDGAWHHVAATRDALTGTLSLYVDGRLQATGPGPLGWRYGVKGLTVGAMNAGPGGYLRGSVDEVAVYTQALSAAAVAR
ncbi:MAG: hypothetical protein JWN32_1112, partial [Solirubrobacterales bacterium]|nr:hypothetical protein [Solirubrobacterales bacterium]